MALRSLVGMLKALPRRMPGSGAFALKGNPCSKSSANRLGYIDEVLPKEDPLLHQRIMCGREERRRAGRIYDMYTVLIGIIGLGSVGRLAANV